MTEFCRLCGTQKYVGRACPGAKCAALRLVRTEQHAALGFVPIVQRKPDTIQPDPFKNIHIIKQCEAVVDAWDKRQEIQ